MINSVLLGLLITALSAEIYNAQAKMKQIIWCLDSLQKVKTALNVNYINKSLEKKKIYTLAVFTIHTVVVLSNGLIYVFMSGVSVYVAVMCICNAIQMMMIYCLALQFALCAMEVYSALSVINDALERLIRPITVKERRRCWRGTVAKS
ncbi:unnamed protein product [Diatraea saccharalis]|uniref:Odorant receptor n=1 Tax=Diatraea saccharalis TaxID=40085 RepID=A0A9N9REW7_9NEOP|nr:unnamed protein product [Diatraea saccharalis]